MDATMTMAKDGAVAEYWAEVYDRHAEKLARRFGRCRVELAALRVVMAGEGRRGTEPGELSRDEHAMEILARL